MEKHMDPNLKDKILRSVEMSQSQITDFLQQLIQIESETGHEGMLQEFIAEKLHKMGLKVDKWVPDIEDISKHPAYIPTEMVAFSGRPNIVGIYEGTGSGKSLLFNGHVDTITADPKDEWEFDPFSGKIQDGKIYGRGASDMKGGLAAMTMALDILLNLRIRPKGSVILEYVIDEELTGYGTLSCIIKGYRADAGISCETSDLCVQPAAIGRLWFTMKVKGKPASISNRWEAVSPIEKGYKLVEAVDDLEKIRIDDLKHPLYPDNRGALPCMVCMFQAGNFPSAVPDSALLRGSLGIMPYENVKEVQHQFKEHIYSVSSTDPWLRNHLPEISFKEIGADGAEIPSDHPIVNTVAKAFEEVTGQNATISGREGGADTRYLIKYGETPTVIFGPGVTSQMHATNECIPISNLLTATKTLALTIVEWCGYEVAL
jgi:acetylornithine deacetylase